MQNVQKVKGKFVEFSQTFFFLFPLIVKVLIRHKLKGEEEYISRRETTQIFKKC